MTSDNVDSLGFMRVARALAVQESRVMRAYCRAGKVLIASSAPVFDEALRIVSSRRTLVEFERGLLSRETAPAASVA